MKKDIIFKLEVIDGRSNTITDRFKTHEPISIIEAIVKHGETLVNMDWKEALINWDKDIRELEDERNKKK